MLVGIYLHRRAYKPLILNPGVGEVTAKMTLRPTISSILYSACWRSQRRRQALLNPERGKP